MAKYPHLSIASQASINGVNPKLLTALDKIAMAGGYTITINSGYRSPDYSQKVGGYANDPHSRGEAVDAYIGGKPIGEVIPLSTFQRFGLEGGNQPGFYNGKTDAEHVQIPGSGVHKDMTSPVLSQATGVPSQKNIPPAGLTDGSSSAAQQFVQAVSRQTGVSPQVLNFWINQEGAYAPNGTGGFNFLNLRPEKGDPYASVSPGNFERFNNLDNAVQATVNRIKEPFMSTLMGAVKQGADPAAQWQAITQTGWDAGHYKGTTFDPNQQASGGPTSTGTTPTGTPMDTQGTKQAPPYDPSTAILQLLRMAGSGGATYKPVNLAIPPMPTQTGGGLPQANFKPFGIGPLQTP